MAKQTDPHRAELKAIAHELRSLHRELSRDRQFGVSDPDRLIEAALSRVLLNYRYRSNNRFCCLPLPELRLFCRDLLNPRLTISAAHRRLRGRRADAGPLRTVYRFAEHFRDECCALVSGDAPPPASSAGPATTGRKTPTRGRVARHGRASRNRRQSA